jgi:hypothetical protein
MSEETKDKQAFGDFKNSLTVQEFETIYRICKERYVRLSKVLEGREKFISKILEQVDQTAEQVENIPEEKQKDALKGITKLMKALGKKGDRKMYNDLKEDILESRHLTEFLNRFSADSESYEQLDFSFLKEIAEKDEV